MVGNGDDVFGFLCFFMQGGEFIGCFEGVVGVFVLYELMGVVVVEVEVFGLVVRFVGIVLQWVFVGGEVQLLYYLENVFFVVGDVVVVVGVFYLQDEVVFVLVGEGVVEQFDVCCVDVWVVGGVGGNVGYVWGVGSRYERQYKFVEWSQWVCFGVVREECFILLLFQFLFYC